MVFLGEMSALSDPLLFFLFFCSVLIPQKLQCIMGKNNKLNILSTCSHNKWLFFKALDRVCYFLHMMNISSGNHLSFHQLLDRIKISPLLLFCYLRAWNSLLFLEPQGWRRVDKVSWSHPEWWTEFYVQKAKHKSDGNVVCLYSVQDYQCRLLDA